MSVYVNVVIESRKCKSYKAEAVFCLWYTTPREEVMQDELCCLSVCLHWSHSDNKPTCVTSTARFKLPAGVCVCIFQHDWHLCESNPCSTTLTWWTLLIQVYCHSFLAAPIGSDLPPFRVKRDANRKSFSHLTDSLFLMLSFCSRAVSLILLGHLVVLRMAGHLECDGSGPPSAV